MTLEELEAHVQQQLPGLHRTFAGRRLVKRIIDRAVLGWPIPVLEQCDFGETQIVSKYYAREVERAVRADMQMGFLAMLVFSALVQEVIKILVRWWFERQENRNAMRLIVREARHA